MYYIQYTDKNGEYVYYTEDETNTWVEFSSLSSAKQVCFDMAAKHNYRVYPKQRVSTRVIDYDGNTLFEFIKPLPKELTTNANLMNWHETQYGRFPNQSKN